MMLSPLRETREERQARIARLMAEAMQRDVEGQRRLIDARAHGETDAVYWEERPGFGGLAAERRRKDQVQCSMIRIHLASEGIRREIERARTLLGLS